MRFRVSARAYFRIRPRGFIDGLRLLGAFAASLVLKGLAPSRFQSVGLLVRGVRNLRVSVDGIGFDVRPKTNDLDIICPKYEPLTTSWFKVEAGDVMVDVGAHIGRYTMIAARNGATVVAIEPDPANFGLLKRNVELNELQEVTVLRQAMTSNPGTLLFSLAPPHNTGSSAIVETNPRSGSGPLKPGLIEVEGNTLDNIVRKHALKRIDWLKIDVEGHESPVLDGARHALGITRRLILEVTEVTKDLSRRALEKNGFRIVAIEQGDPTSNWLAERCDRDSAGFSSVTGRSSMTRLGDQSLAEQVPHARDDRFRSHGIYGGLNEKVTEVSVGICAHDEEQRIPALLESLFQQVLPESFVLKEILVVASGCRDRTEEIVKNWATRDDRIHLISEPSRTGKASSLNQVFHRYVGDVLVLVNGDARLFPNSLSAILTAFRGCDSPLICCGLPVPEERSDLLGLTNVLLWDLHNRTLQVLSDGGIANHCCDELMALRRGIVDSVPMNLINDGAYLAALASVYGFSVRFVPEARVCVASPASMNQLISQRRRITRGHQQIRRLLGTMPRTLDGIFRERPDVAIKILGAELLQRRFAVIAFLLVALPIEICAKLLAYSDEVRKRAYNPVWPRVRRIA